MELLVDHGWTVAEAGNELGIGRIYRLPAAVEGAWFEIQVTKGLTNHVVHRDMITQLGVADAEEALRRVHEHIPLVGMILGKPDSRVTSFNSHLLYIDERPLPVVLDRISNFPLTDDGLRRGLEPWARLGLPELEALLMETML
jgi:hypothetical protein